MPIGLGGNMSRFIEKLKQASQSEPQPLGFRTVQKTMKPRLLVVAAVDQPDGENIAEIAANADACLFSVEKQAELKAVKKMIEAVQDIPCGCRIGPATVKVSVSNRWKRPGRILYCSLQMPFRSI
jgi:hypothetical protein